MTTLLAIIVLTVGFTLSFIGFFIMAWKIFNADPYEWERLQKKKKRHEQIYDDEIDELFK